MAVRVVGDEQWYRIDKADGKMLAVNGMTVARAAKYNHRKPIEAAKSGRFETPCFIYSRGKHLTMFERTVPE